MEFYKKLEPKHQRALKAATAVLVAVIVFGAIIALIKPSAYGPMAINTGRGGGVMMDVASQVAPAYDSNYSYESGVGAKGMMLSARNIAPVPPQYGGTTGSDAEKYEVTDYNATIETTNLDSTCGTILSWKSKDYVVFENSNTSDRSCSHTFKVKKANVTEILAALKSLGPKNISENVYTIKEQVKDYTSQEDILKKKLVTLDETLKSALSAYSEITTIATKANDAGALAKIIDSKLQMIERLTNEKLNVSTQLDYISRSKADELDKLDYTRFYVSVYENKYVDGRNIKDSWKQAVRDFVYNANQIAQAVTVGFVEFVFYAIQFILYIFLIVVVAKYGWRLLKGFWKR